MALLRLSGLLLLLASHLQTLSSAIHVKTQEKSSEGAYTATPRKPDPADAEYLRSNGLDEADYLDGVLDAVPTGKYAAAPPGRSETEGDRRRSYLEPMHEGSHKNAVNLMQKVGQDLEPARKKHQHHQHHKKNASSLAHKIREFLGPKHKGSHENVEPMRKGSHKKRMNLAQKVGEDWAESYPMGVPAAPMYRSYGTYGDYGRRAYYPSSAYGTYGAGSTYGRAAQAYGAANSYGAASSYGMPASNSYRAGRSRYGAWGRYGSAYANSMSRRMSSMRLWHPDTKSELADDSANQEFVVSADFGGDVKLNFKDAVPQGITCRPRKADDGWEMTLFSVPATYDADTKSLTCSMPPIRSGESSPVQLYLQIDSWNVIEEPIRVVYSTACAVSFDRRPYYAAESGELLIRTNIPEKVAANDTRLQLRVFLPTNSGYSLKQLLAVDVQHWGKAVFKVPFEGLEADMDEFVRVEIWKSETGIAHIMSTSYESRNDDRKLLEREIRLIRVSTTKRGQSAVDFKHRSFLVDERPFFPIAWFSTYLDFGLESTIQSLRDMARRGVNSMMMYNLIGGPGPKGTSYKLTELPLNPNVGAILDAAASMGIKFQISLLEIIRPLGSGYEHDFSLLDETVLKWKDHPATMAWYVADDDAGSKLPEIYQRIRRLDPHHIITMAVVAAGKTKERRFLRGSDTVMVENYPNDAGGAYNNMAVIKNWPTEFMPAITCGRSWAIAEDGAVVSQQLFRAQLYQALIAGTTGEIWFAYRNADGWNEPGIPLEEASSAAARELLDLVPAFIQASDYDPDTYIPPTTATASIEPLEEPLGPHVTAVRSRAFREKSGCVTLLISNALNKPIEATVQFEYGTHGIYDESTERTEAMAIFELGEKLRRAPVINGKLVEFMPALGVQVFRLNGTDTCANDMPSPSAKVTMSSPNLLLNPSFEEFGAYISDPLHWVCGMSPNGGDGSACFADTHVKVDGRHAGRFATGASPERFHIHPDVEFPEDMYYRGSVWAQSDKPGLTLTVGTSPKKERAYQRNLAPEEFTPVDSLTLTNEWQEFKFRIHLSPKHWLVFKANTTGVIWLDKASLVPDRARRATSLYDDTD